MADVLVHHLAIVGAGRGRRLAALLHPDRRRIRHSRSARRLTDRDDRAGDLDRIFRQQGLADRRSRRRRPGLPFGHADRGFPASGHARHGTWLRWSAAKMRKLSAFNIAALALGIGFLYLPIVILVVYSFNASRLVAVWGGWSMRWYTALAHDAALLQAASISFRVAFISAFIATFLGTLAAVALVRFGRFRGRLPFAAMIYAPLVMPEVITGLSMLLLFVAVSIDRGFWTVVIAHTTMATCFVAVIVQ